MRPTVLRHSMLGFGGLVRRNLAAEESRRWVTPYLTDPGVRRDVATFARAWRGDELVDSVRWLSDVEQPVLLAWAPGDRFFTYDLAQRLLATFPDATLVDFPGARTFVSLDQPQTLADEIVKWVGAASAS
jgi:pimeloyl-ACP methyl ester carboxylesterase